MKPRKDYHEVSEAAAVRGFSDALVRNIPDDQAPYDSVLDEILENNEGGFIDRQNVYDRI